MPKTKESTKIAPRDRAGAWDTKTKTEIDEAAKILDIGSEEKEAEPDTATAEEGEEEEEETVLDDDEVNPFGDKWEE